MSQRVLLKGEPKTVALEGKPYEKVQADVSADNAGQIVFEVRAVGRQE